MAEKSSLQRQFARVLAKRGYSLPLVSQAVLAYENGAIKHNMITDFLTRREFRDKLDKIGNCGTLFEVREYGESQVIHNGNYCKNPLVCPVCADRVSRRRRAIWSPRIRKAVKKYPFVYMMVLTIEDGPDLRKQLDKLTAARRNFRLMGQKRRAGKTRSGGESAKMRAATINTEIVFAENGNVHAHDHMLVFCDQQLNYSLYDTEEKKRLGSLYGKNIPKEELFKIANTYTWVKGKLIPSSKVSREWIRSTKGNGVNIECIPLNYRNYLDNPFCKGKYVEKYDDWLVMNSVECLKYNSKLSTDLINRKITAQQYADLILKKGCKRFFNTLGDFRDPNDSLYFDQQEIDRLEYIEKIKNSEYVIRSAQLHQARNDYDISAPLQGAIFSDSDPPSDKKRYKLKLQGLIMGNYRKDRKYAMMFREKPHKEKDGFDLRLEKHLDNLRAAMKGLIKNVWKSDLTGLNFNPLYGRPACLT